MAFGTIMVDQVISTTGTVDLTNVKTNNATTGADGYMSAGDKTKLDGIEVDGTGNVGLGTASPGSFHGNANNLVIEDSGETGLTISTTSTGASAVSVIHFADGSVGAASYAGYIAYLHDVDALQFGSNTIEGMRLDSEGRLLLGTTTEGYASADNFTVADLGNCGVTIRSGAANLGTIAFSDATSGAGEYSGYIQYNHTSTYMAFATNENERMRIDSSGRLLVGTSTARNVGYPVTFNSLFESTNYGGLAVVTNRSADTDGSYLCLAKTRGTAVGSNTIVQNGDILGRILFAGADGTDVESRAAQIECQVDGTPGANDMPGRLVFSTTADGAASPTERMRIDSAGALCIGRTSSVQGTNRLAIEGDGTNTIIGIQTASNGTVTALAFFDASGNDCGEIVVNGTPNTTNYSSTSDYRVKENVVELTGAIARLNNLAPKRFNFISDSSKTVVDGFIAHEAQTVVPEAVTGTYNEVDDEGNPVHQGIDQSKLVPLLTAALQEAIAKIETLEQRLSDAGIA